MNKIKELNNGKGYFQLKLKDFELKSIRRIINNHYLENIDNNYPTKKKLFKRENISSYHKVSKYIDHKKTWPMRARTLPKNKYKEIVKLPFIKNLKKIFGNFNISDEYNIGHEEMYWRIVRPKKKSDVGPLHCDKWFWDLNNDYTPKNKIRVKCWISIWCKGLNGLQIYPGSQLKEFKYNFENRDGEKKPVFKLKSSKKKIKKLNCKPGTMIIFNDKLLHGGTLNSSSITRVSIEFTMLVNKKYLN